MQLRGEWAARFLGFVVFLLCFETVLFVLFASKQTKTQAKQAELRFVSVLTENIFCLFRGPSIDECYSQKLRT